MTAPETGTALLILVGFVLPGFVAVLLKERLYEVRGEESTSRGSDGATVRPPGDRPNAGVWIPADEIRLVDHYAIDDGIVPPIEERG